MIFEVEMCPERGGYVSCKSNIMHIGLRSFVISLKKVLTFGRVQHMQHFCGDVVCVRGFYLGFNDMLLLWCECDNVVCVSLEFVCCTLRHVCVHLCEGLICECACR